MKILFVLKDIDIEHINIMLLSSILKHHGHHTAVCEAEYSKMRKELRKGDYQMVAYTVPSIYKELYLRLNRQIKEQYSIFSIFGGPHPTFCPDMINEDGVDCVCLGEGEGAMTELADNLETGAPIEGIKNLWVKKGGRVYRNGLRPLVEDLDNLPFPDRYLMPDSETFSKGKMHVMTGRGCPYSCSYCCQPSYNKLYSGLSRRIRRRSVDSVLKEISSVTGITDIRLVMFEDDLFISSHEWLMEFSLKYPAEIGVPFFCYVRPDLMDDNIAALLRSAGCTAVSMGVETADERIRKEVLNRDMDNNSIVAAARAVRSAGLKLETMNILGIPGGGIKSDMETLSLNIKCRPQYGSAKLLVPYPGTGVREYADREGMMDVRGSLSLWKSQIDFGSNREKMAIENMRKLFPLAVEFPFLVPFVKKIIYLPLGRLYRLINIVWEGYASYFRLYPTGFKGFMGGMKKYARILRDGI